MITRDVSTLFVIHISHGCLPRQLEAEWRRDHEQLDEAIPLSCAKKSRRGFGGGAGMKMLACGASLHAQLSANCMYD